MSKASSFRNSIQLVGIIVGGLLISLPVVPKAANAQQQPTAQPNSAVNPCPSVFYEEPHNSQVLVPQGCPPNAFTSRSNAQGMNSGNSVGATPSSEQIRLGVGGEAPSTSQNYNSQVDPSTGNNVNGSAGGYTNQGQLSPNSQTSNSRYRNAVATVIPTDGKVNVRLVNRTNATIAYQVIGNTQLRTLAGRSEVMLQGLQTPTNVAFYRQDRGLLMVTPQSTANGMLDVTFQETTDFATDRTSMRINNNGSVYLN